MRQICKSFPGVRALHQVDLDLAAGEVLALMGENGAGKSTLIKTLAGAHTPDSGQISIAGQPVKFLKPQDAKNAGVAVIYQEFNLIPALSASDNIFLGREKSSGGIIRQREQTQRAAALFERLGVDIHPTMLCRDLTVAQQQIVEIARALAVDARVLVMDEPSATLTLQEVELLFQVIRELRESGLGIVYISHRLDEVFTIADRVTILRDGENVGGGPMTEVSRDQIIEMMVGRTLDQEYPPCAAVPGDKVRLNVTGLARDNAVRNVSFSVRAGERLGITGLVGAGRTETARLIFGADHRDNGTIEVDGVPQNIRHPREAIAAGICLLTEDRKTEGLVLKHSVRENFGLPNLAEFSTGGFISHKKEATRFEHYVSQFQIRIPHQEQPAGFLSGGNQQKVVLAKWIQQNCDVIIFDEPTRGIDVGARFEIYKLVNELAQQGKAIILISSELPEVLGMSDRILVMSAGRITGEIQDVAAATQEEIMKLAVRNV